MKHSHKDFIHQSFAKHFRQNSFGEIWNLSEKFSQQTNRCLKQGECRFGSITMGMSVMLGHLNLVSDGYCLVYGFCLAKQVIELFDAQQCRDSMPLIALCKRPSVRAYTWAWRSTGGFGTCKNTHPKPHLCPLSVPRHQIGAWEGPICSIIPNVLIM